MLGNIVEIIDNQVFINLNIDISNQTNLINLHVIFEDETKKIVGEIVKVNKQQMVVNIVGELKEKNFYQDFPQNHRLNQMSV